MVSEWTTKEELLKGTGLKEDEGAKEIAKLINKGSVDADYSDVENPKFKINDNFDIPKFLDGLDKKYGFSDRSKKIEGEHNARYYPVIRHGYLHLKHKLETKKDYPEDLLRMCKEQVGFDLTEKTPHLLDEANVFEVPPKVVWILSKTNNQIFYRELPFERTVLDCDVRIDNLWFKGFFLMADMCWTYYGDTDGFCDEFFLFTIFDEKGTRLDSKELDSPDWIRSGSGPITKSTLKKLRVFICNFLDFLNNPEVKIVRFERSKKNVERRIREGKEVLPSISKIFVTGELKQYVEKLSFDKFSYGYRFWVRGHFSRFWNKKRYKKLYDLLERNELPKKYYVDDKIRPGNKVIMIWNKPYVKGSGVLISKKYELKKIKRKRERK